MTVRKKGLGRGLGALGLERPEDIFKDPPKGKKTPAAAAVAATPAVPADPDELPVGALQPGKYQPRLRMDDESIAGLAASIKENGLVSPIVVRPVSASSWEIIAGERRFRAAKAAGLSKVPVVVRRVSDKEALSISLIENIQREDLNPVEEARGVSRLMTEFGLTQERVAEILGKSRPAVANTVRLLKLDPKVLQLLEEGKLDSGHGKALLMLEGAEQVMLAVEAAAKGWSVREVEALAASRTKSAKGTEKKAKPEKSRDVILIEESLAEIFGTSVMLKLQGKEKGSIVISYSSLDQLDGLLSRLGYTP